MSMFSSRLETSGRVTTTTPAKTIISRLRTRATTGFSRLLRGTAHAVLRTFCAAEPSPVTP